MSQYAQPVDYAQFWSLTLDLSDAALVSQLNRILTQASAIVAVNIQGGGPLSLWVSAEWGAEYLKTLTVVLTAVMFSPVFGPRLDTAEKQMWLDWLSEQYRLIRSGEIDPSGGTGAGFPAFGSIQYSHTPWSAAEIIAGRMARGGG